MITKLYYGAEYSIELAYDGHMEMVMDMYSEPTRRSVDLHVEDRSIRLVKEEMEDIFLERIKNL